MVNRIMLNETAYFGRGARAKLVEELLERGHDKVLVVTDFNLVDNRLVNMVTDLLDKNGITYSTFFNIKQNPTVKNVQEGIDYADEKHKVVTVFYLD